MASPSKARVGKYEMGKTLGEGNFAKVRFARNTETGQGVAIKIMDRNKVLKHKMVDQIKREISTMKLVQHPNIVQIYEVLASKTKIHIVLELVTGGELLDKIIQHSRLLEDEARNYFQQLINAVDYCHSRGVFHRDLKPENLLLDSTGILKISDFGLSALPEQLGADGLLHTTCGSPNYVAPEVISDKGYDGAQADLWSCGVVLYVLMAGYLPFDEPNVMKLYKKIHKAEFTFPAWFSTGARTLIKRMLDPNPQTRITIPEILKNEWFLESYVRARFQEEENMNLDDVHAAFDVCSENNLVTEKKETVMNAFDLISTSQGLDLSPLFEQTQSPVHRETRFTCDSTSSKEIFQRIEEVVKPLGFATSKGQSKMTMKGDELGRKGRLSVATEVFEVAPSLHMVEITKTSGDTLEYNKFYSCLSQGIKDILMRKEPEVTTSTKADTTIESGSCLSSDSEAEPIKLIKQEAQPERKLSSWKRKLRHLFSRKKVNSSSWASPNSDN